ncbi:class I SAM-dependent methyltransferase [Saccharopolyspora spinosporotrichia]
MYEGGFAELYDRFYRGRGKDYAAEAAQVARLVRDRLPSASSLLDVACGTGTHLRRFADLFDDVTGLELSAAMIEVARPQLGGIPVLQGDMRDFALDREFDAVTCMFSSIGHMRDGAELDQALASFARHLAPGGVVVVEPWWFPEDFLDGYVAGDVVRDGDLTISRVSHSARRRRDPDGDPLGRGRRGERSAAPRGALRDHALRAAAVREGLHRGRLRCAVPGGRTLRTRVVRRCARMTRAFAFSVPGTGDPLHGPFPRRDRTLTVSAGLDRQRPAAASGAVDDTAGRVDG